MSQASLSVLVSPISPQAIATKEQKAWKQWQKYSPHPRSKYSYKPETLHDYCNQCSGARHGQKLALSLNDTHLGSLPSHTFTRTHTDTELLICRAKTLNFLISSIMYRKVLFPSFDNSFHERPGKADCSAVGLLWKEKIGFWLYIHDNEPGIYIMHICICKLEQHCLTSLSQQKHGWRCSVWLNLNIHIYCSCLSVS